MYLDRALRSGTWCYVEKDVLCYVVVRSLLFAHDRERTHDHVTRVRLFLRNTNLHSSNKAKQSRYTMSMGEDLLNKRAEEANREKISVKEKNIREKDLEF